MKKVIHSCGIMSVSSGTEWRKIQFSVNCIWLELFFLTPLGVISLVQCRWTDFLCCPSALTPYSAHTHTHIHFALREHRFRHYFCLTATQTGLQNASGQFTIGVHTYIHRDPHIRPGSHVRRHPSCRTGGMWKSLGHASTCVSLLSFMHVTYNERANSWVTVQMYSISVKVRVDLKVSCLFKVIWLASPLVYTAKLPQIIHSIACCLLARQLGHFCFIIWKQSTDNRGCNHRDRSVSLKR